MKFKKILILTAVCLLAFSVLTACKKKIEKYNGNISELRVNVYEGGNENMNINAITGKRENPYILDGHCSGTQDFTVITIEPSNYISTAKYSYRATIDGVEYTGEFNPHPFGKSFSADIKAQSKSGSITCDVILNGATEAYTLNSVKTADMISEEKALDIAAQRLKKQIRELEAGGKLNAEIYIRLIANPIDNSGGYRWYVAFVGESQNVYAVLIEPITMEIVAVRD